MSDAAAWWELRLRVMCEGWFEEGATRANEAH